MYLPVVSYEYQNSNESKIVNVLAAVFFYISENFLGLFQLLETLVQATSRAVAYTNTIES